MVQQTRLSQERQLGDNEGGLGAFRFDSFDGGPIIQDDTNPGWGAIGDEPQRRRRIVIDLDDDEDDEDGDCGDDYDDDGDQEYGGDHG